MANSFMASARYEIKMTCSETYLPDARSWVRLHPQGLVEAYPPRQVNNLYLDTRSADALNDVLVGAGERGKLRFRWYGIDDSAVRGVLELKSKSGQVRWKEFAPVPVTLDLTTISWDEWLRHLRAHAQGNVAAALLYADQPMLINRYMREYYETLDRQVRVTLDYDQRAYSQAYHVAPNLALLTPLREQVVIEVKAEPAHYQRVSDVLSAFPISTERNSKYVNALLGPVYF
jgi:hypothetical protein